MRKILLTLSTLFWIFAFSSSSLAQNDFSEVLAKSGLSGANEWLQGQPKSEENKFLLGGVKALSAIEYILQVRYNNYSGELPIIPGGRANLSPNPDAVFDPAFIEVAMKGALKNLKQAEIVLASVVGKEFSVEVNLVDLWFDINANGKRDAGEDLVAQLSELPGFARGDKGKSTIVRFDSADAYWLAAYVQALSGSAELVLALDPTSAIKTIIDGRALMEEKGAITPDPFLRDVNIIDSIAVYITALRGVPDKKRTRAALKHFKSMISYNQGFWRLVMQETDNKAEWLPNPSQTSAFGIAVDLETANAWQTVLKEISDVLEGRALIPHWRVTSRDATQGVGINIKKLMNDPSDFDIILMIQGTSIAPYLEQGKIANMRVWRDFSRLTDGQGILFSLWFN